MDFGGYRHTGLDEPKKHSTKTKVGEKKSSGKAQLIAFGLSDALLYFENKTDLYLQKAWGVSYSVNINPAFSNYSAIQMIKSADSLLTRYFHFPFMVSRF